MFQTLDFLITNNWIIAFSISPVNTNFACITLQFVNNKLENKITYYISKYLYKNIAYYYSSLLLNFNLICFIN